jgi:hypothetical protein
MIIDDITTAMPDRCRKNREIEARQKAWDAAHTTESGAIMFGVADLENHPSPPVYVLIDRDGRLAIDAGATKPRYHDVDLARVTTPDADARLDRAPVAQAMDERRTRRTNGTTDRATRAQSQNSLEGET